MNNLYFQKTQIQKLKYQLGFKLTKHQIESILKFLIPNNFRWNNVEIASQNPQSIVFEILRQGVLTTKVYLEFKNFKDFISACEKIWEANGIDSRLHSWVHFRKAFGNGFYYFEKIGKEGLELKKFGVPNRY